LKNPVRGKDLLSYEVVDLFSHSIRNHHSAIETANFFMDATEVFE